MGRTLEELKKAGLGRKRNRDPMPYQKGLSQRCTELQSRNSLLQAGVRKKTGPSFTGAGCPWKETWVSKVVFFNWSNLQTELPAKDHLPGTAQ